MICTALVHCTLRVGFFLCRPSLIHVPYHYVHYGMYHVTIEIGIMTITAHHDILATLGIRHVPEEPGRHSCQWNNHLRVFKNCAQLCIQDVWGYPALTYEVLCVYA